MKKFIFLYIGDEGSDSTEDWMNWFSKIEGSIVDSGNPFGHGKEITGGKSVDLDHGKDAVTGYSIFNAESMEDAEKLLECCPAKVVRIYEAMPM